jgi:hypothetical protein
MQTRTLMVTALAISLGSTASAQPSRCTREILTVEGTPLTVGYCVSGIRRAPAGENLPVAVTETFSSPHGSLTRNATLQFIAGEESSRVIEDLPLARVGLSGTLHLTLLWHGGLVRVDSAMLTPGAITVK